MAILRKEDLNDTTWKIISVTYVDDKRDNTDNLEDNYTATFCLDGTYCEGKGSFSDKLLNDGIWSIDEETNIVCIQHRKSNFFKRSFTILSYDGDKEEMTATVNHPRFVCSLYATYDTIIWKKVP
ncbi:MAG: hypothetical protein SLAVMIC_00626 [uncultured marine phage]|uniref:Lipocalin-like domain-containing protein n=1 Tax=uncultured marine phage TaxID=707152 RepID=A0A8D9CEJ1_9VIRU|nr:MAG: hypothetical protein SLAVMIC_00626 [uncultured marine phage]